MAQTLAGWQRGYAADCNSVYAGSNPTPASNPAPASRQPQRADGTEGLMGVGGVVPGERLELSHGRPYQILSLARLPISPPRQGEKRILRETERESTRLGRRVPRYATVRPLAVACLAALHPSNRTPTCHLEPRHRHPQFHVIPVFALAFLFQPLPVLTPWRVSSQARRKAQGYETRLAQPPRQPPSAPEPPGLVTTNQRPSQIVRRKCRDMHTDSWYCPSVSQPMPDGRSA